VSYRWYPEGWIVDWGPALNANWLWDYEAVLQEQGVSPGVSVQFARNVRANWDYDQGMERFNGIDFQKKRMTFGGSVNTSRRVSFSGSYSTGDQIRYVTDPFLGSGTTWNTNVTLRPSSRLQAQITVNTSRFVEPRTGIEVFDVKIFRTQTTYQFTERFLIRNITQHNTFDNTLDLNLLFTYRVNGGTVFFVGYDDHYREGYQLNKDLFPTGDLQRTNRAAFAKLQYLFRYD
jgi:hypothetical protein